MTQRAATSGESLHIAFFGLRNAGKSSLVGTALPGPPYPIKQEKPPDFPGNQAVSFIHLEALRPSEPVPEAGLRRVPWG